MVPISPGPVLRSGLQCVSVPGCKPWRLLPRHGIKTPVSPAQKPLRCTDFAYGIQFVTWPPPFFSPQLCESSDLGTQPISATRTNPPGPVQTGRITTSEKNRGSRMSAVLSAIDVYETAGTPEPPHRGPLQVTVPGIDQLPVASCASRRPFSLPPSPGRFPPISAGDLNQPPIQAGGGFVSSSPGSPSASAHATCLALGLLDVERAAQIRLGWGQVALSWEPLWC